MAFKIDEAFVEINARNAGLNQGLGAAQSKMQKFSGFAKQWGRKMTMFVTLPLTLAGVALAKVGIDAVEAENLFTVSLGKMAGEAREWSKEMKKSLGVSEFATRQQVGTFNVMLEAMGLNTREAYEMSKGLVQLTNDMASFFNLRSEDAFQKIQAGITGEMEPLKRLGIVLSETRVKQHALNTGLVQQGQKLTENQKILARYSLLMKDTSKAQGDMARTSDDAAGRLRRVKAELSDTAKELGMALIPMVQKAISGFAGLAKSAGKLVGHFNSLSQSNQVLATKAVALAIVLGPLVWILGALASAVAAVKSAAIGLAAILGISTGGLTLIIGALLLSTGLIVSDLAQMGTEADFAAEGVDELAGAMGRLNSEGERWQDLGLPPITGPRDTRLSPPEGEEGPAPPGFGGRGDPASSSFVGPPDITAQAPADFTFFVKMKEERRKAAEAAEKIAATSAKKLKGISERLWNELQRATKTGVDLQKQLHNEWWNAQVAALKKMQLTEEDHGEAMRKLSELSAAKVRRAQLDELEKTDDEIERLRKKAHARARQRGDFATGLGRMVGLAEAKDIDKPFLALKNRLKDLEKDARKTFAPHTKALKEQLELVKRLGLAELKGLGVGGRTPTIGAGTDLAVARDISLGLKGFDFSGLGGDEGEPVEIKGQVADDIHKMLQVMVGGKNPGFAP